MIPDGNREAGGENLILNLSHERAVMANRGQAW